MGLEADNVTFVSDEAAAVTPPLQQIAAIQLVEMQRHPEGSPEYKLARLEWSKAQVGLCKAKGDTNMAEAYQREVTHYERLVSKPE